MNFMEERGAWASSNWSNVKLREAANSWHDLSISFNYQYMFEFWGLPIIQDPQDVCMQQELIWKIRPTLVIETGVARGGSLALSAATMAAISYSELLSGASPIHRRVVGVDVDIRAHNRAAIESHPLGAMISLVQGSSIDVDTVSAVAEHVRGDDRVLVILDSDHTEDHVLRELHLYSKFVSPGSAILVMDTGIEFVKQGTFNTQRPWGPGNNPYTATKLFLSSGEGQKYEVCREIERRHLITCAPEGLLMRCR